MTELLTRRRPTSSGQEAVGRPLALNAALAAVSAALVGLGLCWVVSLIGWFASDGGAHGESTSALSVGSGAWLLAHGTDLHLDAAVVTAVPLGLTALCLYAVFRAARWAGATAEVEDLWSLGFATVVLGGTYASLALVLAVVTTTPRVAPDPISAFLGAALIASAAGGAGLVAGSGLRPEFRALLPSHARAVLFGALVGVLSLWSAGAVLAAVAVAVRGESVANVLSRLHVDVAGGFFSLVLVALIAPNLATWGTSYLLGGGFALGTDTVVAPSGVVTGPVPAVPVLAAVPTSGPAPTWALGVLVVPAVCGLLVGWVVTRRFPTSDLRVAAARAGGGAGLAAVALTVLAGWSGGSIGGGRMRDLGPDLSMVLVTSLVSLGVGAVMTALGYVWWQRRLGVLDQASDDDLGLQRQLPWRDVDAATRRAAHRAAHRDRLRARWKPLGPGSRSEAKVPGWARLGVWGASTPSPVAGEDRETPPDGGPAGPDKDEDTTYLPRP